VTSFIDTLFVRIAVAVLTAVALATPTTAQAPSLINAIAKVRVRPALGRPLATAFVVAVKEGTAWLVTSAHVIAGDQTPTIEFAAAPGRLYNATIRAFEGDDERGLALLVVANVPAGIKALPRSADPIALRDSVSVGGYPASVPALAQLNTSIEVLSGRDLFLKDVTEEGFSGGPVLRNDAVVGIVYGHEGRRGKALGASSIVPFLEGNDLVWATAKSSTGGGESSLAAGAVVPPSGPTASGDVGGGVPAALAELRGTWSALGSTEYPANGDSRCTGAIVGHEATLAFGNPSAAFGSLTAQYTSRIRNHVKYPCGPDSDLLVTGLVTFGITGSGLQTVLKNVRCTGNGCANFKTADVEAIVSRENDRLVLHWPDGVVQTYRAGTIDRDARAYVTFHVVGATGLLNGNFSLLVDGDYIGLLDSSKADSKSGRVTLGDHTYRLDDIDVYDRDSNHISSGGFCQGRFWVPPNKTDFLVTLLLNRSNIQCNIEVR
jgi:hypothetical protein